MLVRIIPRESPTVEHVLLGAQLTTSYFVRITHKHVTSSRATNNTQLLVSCGVVMQSTSLLTSAGACYGYVATTKIMGAPAAGIQYHNLAGLATESAGLCPPLSEP
jgi:hypothetical protein